MQDKLLRVRLPDENRTLYAAPGDMLLDVLRTAGVYVPAVCGGKGRCGSCRVLLDGREVLACRTELHADCMVHPALSEREFEILENPRDGNAVPCAGDRSAVMVADLGTTTVVVQLIDPADGAVLASDSFLNPQRAFGGDVISRIEASEQGHLPALRDLIRRALLDGMVRLLRWTGRDGQSIERVILAGNTTMCYLLLGYDCGSLGRAPFQPAFPHRERYRFDEVFGEGLLSCGVELVAWMSAFVGGDITAGLIACRELHGAKTFLLLDIGTNGEIALWRDGAVLCTSSAAGPALEGAGISCGTGSVPGAIAAVRWEGGGFGVRTVADAPPVGLCGSGVIDLAACLLREGLLEETGLLVDPYFADGVELAATPDGAPIRFTQADVRALQLAKAAVRAGVEVLLGEAGLEAEDLDRVYIAGGFGVHLDLDSARMIGLLSPALAGRAQFCGNTALGGCVALARDPALAQAAQDLARGATELSLGSHRRFNDLFVEHMLF